MEYEPFELDERCEKVDLVERKGSISERKETRKGMPDLVRKLD